MGKISLLDCTLRDGGYVNDWLFGHDNIVNTFERLVAAEVDIVEIGFIDERRPFDINRTIMPDTQSVEHIYGNLDKGNTMVVGMIDYGTCDLYNIQTCNDSYLDGIRIIFKKEEMHEAISFCKQIKELGYKVFVQAVSITSYDSQSLKVLLDLVNDLEPYAFSLVDTYGLLHKGNLIHYFNIANEGLNPDIGLGYHAHNNFQLAYANCIELLESTIDRMLIIDGTLYGIGKSAGNAAIELLSMYMNEQLSKKYNINQLLEAIDVTVMDIYRKTPWGYRFKYYLSALNDCHPNYVTYLTDKKKLSVKSINEILEKLGDDKKLLYDQDYVEKLYLEYQKTECDDSMYREQLVEELHDKEILLLGPGNQIEEQRNRVVSYIAQKDLTIIAINFLPKDYKVDYLFISNSKRYVQLSTQLSKKDILITTIATSNVTKTIGCFDRVLNYSSLLDEDALIADNPLIMLLKILKEVEVKSIALAGFDGYAKAVTQNYVNLNMEHTFTKEKAQEINDDVIMSISRIMDITDLCFITDSYYLNI